jgi:hypothetical protein
MFCFSEEPLYKISKEKAEEKKLEHQVRKGTFHTHAIGRPEYFDFLENPGSCTNLWIYQTSFFKSSSE